MFFFMEHLGLKTLEEKTLESDYDKVLFLPVLPILPILTNHPNHPVSLSSICQSSSQSTWEHPMDSVYRELLSWGNPVWHSSFVFCRLEGSDGGWVSPLEDDLKGKTSYIVTVLWDVLDEEACFFLKALVTILGLIVVDFLEIASHSLDIVMI